jgi:hypothetical protein
MLSRRTFTHILVAAAGTGLAGCSSPPPRTRFPDLTYGHLGQFRLNVSRIDVESEYKSPMAAPNIEHLLPVPPEQTLRRWASDRLVATGTPQRFARFVIQDAKVTDTLLPRTPGVRGAFTSDQTNRYDGSLAVRLEVRADRGNLREGEASAWATRSRTVAEGITLNEREKAWFDLVESMMNDINAELDRQIRANLGQFLG